VISSISFLETDLLSTITDKSPSVVIPSMIFLNLFIELVIPVVTFLVRYRVNKIIKIEDKLTKRREINAVLTIESVISKV